MTAEEYIRGDKPQPVLHKVDIVLDKLEQFLDRENAKAQAAVIAAPIQVDMPPDLDAILEEMAMKGILTPPQMNKLVAAIRPVVEENKRLKDEKK